MNEADFRATCDLVREVCAKLDEHQIAILVGYLIHDQEERQQPHGLLDAVAVRDDIPSLSPAVGIEDADDEIDESQRAGILKTVVPEAGRRDR